MTANSSKQSDHTPGPWFTDPSRAVYANSSDRVIKVADTRAAADDGITISEAKANARLIAACPETAAERDQLREVNADLLAALELCLVYAGHGLMDNIYGKQVKLDQIWAVAHAAIEKAKGK